MYELKAVIINARKHKLAYIPYVVEYNGQKVSTKKRTQSVVDP